MKILLVVPSQHQIYGKIRPPDHPHMGLLYIATILDRIGHNVQFVDFDADKMSFDSFIKLLHGEHFAIVGITATTPTYANALEIAKITKSHSDAITVLGGIHATLMPKDCMKSAFFDFVVKGEAEETICELLKAIESGGDLSHVKGILFKTSEKIVETADRPFLNDLDKLPFPSRKLLANKKYKYPDALKSIAFPIITSRGCPGNCSFCTAKFAHGNRFRCRSAQNVVDEIEMLVKEYGAKEIHIWDDNFITNPKRVFQIRDEIIGRGIRCLFAFPNGVRADFVREDILLAMKEMGTYSLAIGVESGNSRILESIRKGITLDQIREAFKNAKKLGLETWGFFLLGLPGEDADTIRQTIDFAIELDPDVAKFHVLKPYPGSEVASILKQKGLLLDENYVHYGIHTNPVHRLESLSSEELANLQREAYRRFFLRPSKLIRQMKRLKTFNRLHLNLSAAISILREKVFKI